MTAYMDDDIATMGTPLWPRVFWPVVHRGQSLRPQKIFYRLFHRKVLCHVITFSQPFGTGRYTVQGADCVKRRSLGNSCAERAVFVFKVQMYAFYTEHISGEICKGCLSFLDQSTSIFKMLSIYS